MDKNDITAADIQQQKDYLKYKIKLYKLEQKQKRHIPTSKIILFTTICILAAAMLFSGYSAILMLKVCEKTSAQFDFSPLNTLISAIAGETVIILGYFAKSAKENSANGIVYETAMAQHKDIADGDFR